MANHLVLLRELFPNTLLLNIEQVAQVLVKAPGTIKDWFYKDKLPFNVVDDPDGFKVSIIELANYLDSCLTQNGEFKNKGSRAKKQELIDMPVIAPAKIGRPRGSKKQDALFAAQLSFACIYQLSNNLLTEMGDEVAKVELHLDNEEALATFSEAKNQLIDKVVKASRELSAAYLSMTLDSKKQSVSLGEKKVVKV